MATRSLDAKPETTPERQRYYDALRQAPAGLITLVGDSIRATADAALKTLGVDDGSVRQAS